MIRIFLNGLAASAGAGLTYLNNVISQLSAVPGVRITIVIQPNLRSSFEQLGNVEIISPPGLSGAARRFIFEQTKLPGLISESGAQVLISTGNFALRNSPVPQILLSGNSLYTSSDFSRDLRSRREYLMLADNFVKGAFAKRSIGWADQTVAPSQAFADELRRWTGRDIAVIPHGFDHASFFADRTPLPSFIRQELSKSDGCLRLLFVTHYNYYRNFETLLRALPLIQNLIPEKPVKLFLTCKLETGANPGSYDAGAAGNLVRTLGIGDSVVQLGPVPYEQLHHLYRACDLYVTPAYAETFAHPLVEAMASGLPIVASDLPVHKEVCGDAAEYFCRFSPEALAKAVGTAVMDKSRLSVNGKARAAEFSWSKHVHLLLHAAGELGERVAAPHRIHGREPHRLLTSKYKHKSSVVLFAIFAFALALGCYLRPMPDDFDRYVYEALIRTERQPIRDVYNIVKHESPRAESSSILDSAEHLAQLEPLYAIRPFYILAVSMVERITVDPQRAINVVSAAAIFLCALLVGIGTRQYFYSALLMLAPGIVITGRLGTPDCFSALALLAAYVSLLKEKMFLAMLILMSSVWIRTDNLLFVLAVLGWLVSKERIKLMHASILALLAIGSVEYINLLAGNYGWKVLLYFSFIGGKYPAEIVPHIGILAYANILMTNAVSLAPQIAPWMLLGLVAWRLGASERGILIPVLIASILHYLLYPSPEARYFVWAYLVTGVVFIRAVSNRRSSSGLLSARIGRFRLSADAA